MSSRRHLHTRQFRLDGYLRDDGLYEVEAALQDITVPPTQLPFKALPAGGVIHDMSISMVFDAKMLIRSVEARTHSGATPYCAEINSAYGKLAGLRIGGGFKQAVRERVGGVAGCTHLTELMDAMATAAFQTTFSTTRDRRAAMPPEQLAAPIPRPSVIDTCHAYRMDGEAVSILWPPSRRAD